MKTETLQKGILALTAAFPSLSFNAKLYQQMLGDLRDEYFLEAVYEVIKTVQEIYPGTNLIAVLRDRAEKIFIAELSGSAKRLRAETEEERRKRWEEESKSPEYEKAREEFHNELEKLKQKTEIR